MKLTEKHFSISAALLIPLLTVAVAQATYTCQGVVTGLQVSPAGVLSAQSVAGLVWPQICSVESTFPNGVPPATCRSILAMLLTAQTTGESVTLWFDDDPANSCATHAAWSNLTGWYYGPMLQP